jgi:hypothetical protein
MPRCCCPTTLHPADTASRDMQVGGEWGTIGGRDATLLLPNHASSRRHIVPPYRLPPRPRYSPSPPSSINPPTQPRLPTSRSPYPHPNPSSTRPPLLAPLGIAASVGRDLT